MVAVTDAGTGIVALVLLEPVLFVSGIGNVDAGEDVEGWAP